MPRLTAQSQARTSTSLQAAISTEGNQSINIRLKEDDPYDFGLPRHKLIVCCGLPYVISQSKGDKLRGGKTSQTGEIFLIPRYIDTETSSIPAAYGRCALG